MTVHLLKTAVGCDDAEALAARQAARRLVVDGRPVVASAIPVRKPRRVRGGWSTAGRSTGSSAGRSGPGSGSSTWSMRSTRTCRGILPDCTWDPELIREPRRRRGSRSRAGASKFGAGGCAAGPGADERRRPAAGRWRRETARARPDLGPGGGPAGSVRAPHERPCRCKGVTKKTGRRPKRLWTRSGGAVYIPPRSGGNGAHRQTGGGPRDADPDQPIGLLRWVLQATDRASIFVGRSQTGPIPKGKRRVAAVRPPESRSRRPRPTDLGQVETGREGMARAAVSCGRFLAVPRGGFVWEWPCGADEP